MILQLSLTQALLRQVITLVAYHGMHDILKTVFYSNDAYFKSNQRMHICIYDAYICYKLNKELLCTYNYLGAIDNKCIYNNILRISITLSSTEINDAYSQYTF